MTTKEFQTWYKSTDTFKYSNPNPDANSKKSFKWDRGDCVIRAVALSTGNTWLDAFDFLMKLGRRDFCTPNDKGFDRKWYVEFGAEWFPIKAESGKRRMTCEEFAKSHPSGRYILSIAHHQCACVDGKILDVWNCGCKPMFGYYNVENLNIKGL